MKTTKRLFTALSALLAMAVLVAGCGSSGSVSGAAVAQVAGNAISVQAFDHWMFVAAKGNAVQSGSPVIVPNDPPNFPHCITQIKAEIPTLAKTPVATLKTECKNYFTQLSTQVMDFLIKAYWYQATAYKDGIRVSQTELAQAFKTAQKQTFPTQTQYKAFLSETGETIQDINFRLRVNTVFQKLINREEPKITRAVELSYYSAHASQFGTPTSRDVKLIQTTSQSQVVRAQAALRSGQSWAAVAKQYSTNAATKSTGGVITGLTAGQEEAAVNSAIFSAPLNRIEGPIHGTFGYYLVEVTKITPATTVAFEKAIPEIKQLLSSQYGQTAQTKINAAVKAQWGARTICKADYSMADCHGYTAPVSTTATTPATSGSSGAASSGSSGATTSGSSAGTSTAPASTVTVNPGSGATSTSSGTTTK